jgi:predicted HD superfamily hydrolase involved in NAD metabolism
MRAKHTKEGSTMTLTVIDIDSVDIVARIEDEMDPDTRAHTRRTAVLARELALVHGVNPNRAEFAALVHDIAGRYTDIELAMLAERYRIPISLTEARVPKLLHAPVGAEILRRDYGVADEEILDAVRNHIGGGPIMSTLSKILFVADKLEPERDRHYHGLDPVRALARENLDQAMLKLYAWRVNELIDAGRPVHERLVTARNMLLENARTEIIGL